MERSLEVQTGESVAIRYELAGVGSRFLAVFVDFAIQIAATLVIIIAVIISAIMLNYSALPRFGSAIAVAAFSISIFLLFFGYFIFFETRWNGETPGKRLIGVRVMRDGGFPIDFMGAVIRNLIRTLEFGLGFYAVSAIVMLLSPENKRLGDFAAGTIVVRNLRSRIPPPIRISEEGAHAAFPMLTPADWDRLLRFYSRRPQLDEEASRRIASVIASQLRPKLSADYTRLSDDELLGALQSIVQPDAVASREQPRIVRGMEFRPVRDEDLSFLERWEHTTEDAAWFARATNRARASVVELDGVPSVCLAHTADNELATEVSIDFFLVSDRLRRDLVSISEVIKSYITKVVCKSHPRAQRILMAPKDDVTVMLALASAGFIRSTGRPLFLNLPKTE